MSSSEDVLRTNLDHSNCQSSLPHATVATREERVRTVQEGARQGRAKV